MIVGIKPRVFFTSDTHFGHRSILKAFNRPFISVREMDEQLIRNWNNSIGKKDHVFHLGDFGYGLNTEEIFGRLNGIKYLIRGNHDTDQVIGLEWNSIQNKLLIKIFNYRFWLSHKPSWPEGTQNCIRLHGHLHLKNTHENVCVDVRDFMPVSLQQILEGANLI